MSDHDHHDDGVSRRGVLECMTWAGTGVLWTSPAACRARSALVGAAQAAEPAGFTFVQISDSHVGFDKPANPTRSARCRKRSTRSTRCRRSRLS